MTSLAPGAYVIIVRNIAAFELRYSTGLPVAGEWEAEDKLDNGGENLKLSFGAGTAIHEFEYEDRFPWPESPDGDGTSLVLVAPGNRPDHADPLSWRPSVAVGGSPAGSDATSFVGDPNADGDGDGLGAFLEYFLGSSDAIAYSSVLPFLAEGTGASAGYPTFIFQINLAADDLVYEVQHSTDLTPVNWASAPAVSLVSLTDNGDGTATVVWQSNTLLADLPSQFMRLLVSERP